MKKGMRFLAVAALSVAMTTAFGQSGTQSTPATSSPSGSGVQQDQPQPQQDRTQPGQGTQQPGQSGTTRQGQGTQGQGMGAGSAEARVKSEVQWMKSDFNLTDSQEQRLHDVLLKYETQSAAGGDLSKAKEEKEKELKAIIGDDNYKIYKEKKNKEKDKTRSTTPTTTPTPTP